MIKLSLKSMAREVYVLTAVLAFASAPAHVEESAQELTKESPKETAEATTLSDQRRVRELGSRVNELKERIYRSKAKLQLLSSALTGGGIGKGAGLTITHRDLTKRAYELVQVSYFLDGAPIWKSTGDEKDKKLDGADHVVWDANIAEGAHTMSVEMVYRGQGYGVFNYHQNYEHTLSDSLTFSVEAGRLLTIESHGFLGGNSTTEPIDRPTIRFETQRGDLVEGKKVSDQNVSEQNNASGS